VITNFSLLNNAHCFKLHNKVQVYLFSDFFINIKEEITKSCLLHTMDFIVMFRAFDLVHISHFKYVLLNS